MYRVLSDATQLKSLESSQENTHSASSRLVLVQWYFEFCFLARILVLPAGPPASRPQKHLSGHDNLRKESKIGMQEKSDDAISNL